MHTHLPAPTVLLHTHLTSYTLPHTLILALPAMVLALMGFLPPSSTYSSFMHMYRLPQHPPLCSFPEPRMSPVSAQPEWLILNGCRAKPRRCLYLKSLPQFYSGREAHLIASVYSGVHSRGWRPHRIQEYLLRGNPQIMVSSQAKGLKRQRTATSSLSALDAPVKASGIFFKAGGQSSRRQLLRPCPR